MDKEKIIKKLKQEKRIYIMNEEIREIIAKELWDGRISGFDPKLNKKMKYRWIE